MKNDLKAWAEEWRARQAAIPSLSPRDCENYLARHYANSAPQVIHSCRRALARTCRMTKREKGKDAAIALYIALRRYVWLPFGRLREEAQANQASAARRRRLAKMAM